MNKTFNNPIEDKKVDTILNSNVLKEVNCMILSNEADIIKYFEAVVSALLLSINKAFPEPNYSIYETHRIKSSNSNISKLSNYITRLKETNFDIEIKEISDLIGFRVIVEKIPHNITIDRNNSEYNTLKELSLERKKNIKLSEQYHEFEETIDDNTCTCYDYYKKSKELLCNIIEMFNSECEYSKDYAIDLKTKYVNLINECEKKLTILEALGNYDSKIDLESLQNEDSFNRIDFKKLLTDFDSRIDGKLALKLFSNAIPDIVENSPLLQKLGVHISSDSSRRKNKREKSGYIADFFGLDFNGIPIKAELQIMYSNEHQESIFGYSAHSKMPGKEANFMQIPPEYVRKNLKLLNNIGNSTFISNEELFLINNICDIKNISDNEKNLLKSLADSKNVVLKNNSPIGIKIKDDDLASLNSLCSLTENEKNILEDKLYKIGCRIFSAWASNISAFHATGRIDKDSSANNRVKIYYDDPYECLAHTIREQIINHHPKSIDSEYYLERVYKFQNEWLKKDSFMSTESSLMDFEINEYARNELPKLLNKISLNNYENIPENDIDYEK